MVITYSLCACTTCVYLSADNILVCCTSPNLEAYRYGGFHSFLLLHVSMYVVPIIVWQLWCKSWCVGTVPLVGFCMGLHPSNQHGGLVCELQVEWLSMEPLTLCWDRESFMLSRYPDWRV